MKSLLAFLSGHAKMFSAAYGSATVALYPIYGKEHWYLALLAVGTALGVAGIPNTPSAPVESAVETPKGVTQ